MGWFMWITGTHDFSSDLAIYFHHSSQLDYELTYFLDKCSSCWPFRGYYLPQPSASIGTTLHHTIFFFFYIRRLVKSRRGLTAWSLLESLGFHWVNQDATFSFSSISSKKQKKKRRKKVEGASSFFCWDEIQNVLLPHAKSPLEQHFLWRGVFHVVTKYAVGL